ncbi:HmuY family protein [Terrimonas sp. NA20]|uniref:HmuY family protein n=1 Tax=Terrimonas ginsenosidimutans TaxID=2908004 RepID=A0ABS9KQK2_9BACT|nr:HmuY family protein [Terrimonas ginsenosidimutans]MCG2614613.1 HmuY family protein [Terrimonas ginsenosidimutans]
MRLTFIKGLLIVATGLLVIPACRKKDAPLPDNLVQFESAEQGITATETSKAIKITLSSAVSANTPLTVEVGGTLDYTTDYTTVPAAVNGKIELPVLSGSREAIITVTKANGALFYADDNLTFKIISSGSPVILGTQTSFKLTFSEIISNGGNIVGEGGGATYGNKVFFDLSANSQTGVLRTKWDLGFYTGADDWRVILNSSSAMMAKQIAKNDLASVTAADTVGFGNTVLFTQIPVPSALPYIDYPDGDLTKTAIAAVSATAADNKVYIVNRGTGVGSPAPARGWKKVRIIRNANGGYTLQHADIAATTFTSIDIPKDATYFFKYVSFETGAVDVEPAAKKWDLAWTYFSFITGGAPYLFQDVILQNRNVQVATVQVAATTYSNFGEANLAGLTWSSVQTTIGSTWRAGGGINTAPVISATQYYIVRDGDNNYYKVRFTALTKEAVRGFPTFEYSLVKKG